MKIQVWALVLIVIGSLALGGLLGFGLSGGFAAAERLTQGAVSVFIGDDTPRPEKARGDAKSDDRDDGDKDRDGGWRWKIELPGRIRPGWRFTPVPKLPEGLPAGFNAGVNIEDAYAELTDRTVEQVREAERKARTDVWGLARKEGKLDELKKKVEDDVAASLKKMVDEGKITQEQSDAYLKWAKQYLEAVGPKYSSGILPGFHRFFPRGWWSAAPEGTTAPAPTATPEPASSEA